MLDSCQYAPEANTEQQCEIILPPMKCENTAPEWVKTEAINNVWIENFPTGASEDAGYKNN